MSLDLILPAFAPRPAKRIFGVTTNRRIFEYTPGGRPPFRQIVIIPPSAALRRPRSLTEHCGVLYAVSDNPRALHTIDPSDGSQAQVGALAATGLGTPAALVSHQGDLLMSDLSRQLWAVNPATAALTKRATWAQQGTVATWASWRGRLITGLNTSGGQTVNRLHADVVARTHGLANLLAEDEATLAGLDPDSPEARSLRGSNARLRATLNALLDDPDNYTSSFDSVASSYPSELLIGDTTRLAVIGDANWAGVLTRLTALTNHHDNLLGAMGNRVYAISDDLRATLVANASSAWGSITGLAAIRA